MLLKKPDSTTSRPLASPVHDDIRSFDTMPSSERSSNTFQFFWPRMAMLDPLRTTG